MTPTKDSVNENHRRTSPIWQVFTRKGNFIAACKVCNKSLSYKVNVSNLNRHWKKAHADMTMDDVDTTDCSDDESNNHSKETKTKQSECQSTWQYFDVLDSDQLVAKCKICEKEIAYDSVSDLKEHVNEHNALVSDDDDEDWVESEPKSSEKKPTKRTNASAVWQYMEVVDEERKIVVCLLCRKQLSYMTGTSNLRKHMHRAHSHISIDGGSLPKLKKMIISTDGQLYEIDNSDGEKDPIQTDTEYLEDSLQDNSIERIQAKTPPKRIKVVDKKRSKSNYIVKEIFRNTNSSIDTNDDTRNDAPRSNRSKTNCLDIFGEYIICLLKQLPKHVSDQLQSDIVKQIFTAKIALESPYSVTLSDKPITVTINNSNRNSMPEITVNNISESNISESEVTNSTECKTVTK